MPAGSGDGEAGDESDESGEMGTGKSDRVYLRDPVLLLADGLERTLRKIDALYVTYEALPGRVQFGLAAVTFLSSTYFGAVIRRVLDAFVVTQFVSAVEILTGLTLGLQLALLLLLFLVFQSSIANHRLKFIGNIVEDEGMDSDDVMPDGGWQVERVETSEAGAVGGAAFGAVFGALFGYGTIFGGMFLGAPVGNLIEERSVRKRKQRRLKARIVEYLFENTSSNPKPSEPKPSDAGSRPTTPHS